MLHFGLNFAIKLFESGNVTVCGLRGTGKDMLTSNVIARRKTPYISNVDYKCSRSVFIPLDIDKLDVRNNFETLLSGNTIDYNYPYPENCDIYISDAGIYFPSQYFTKLDKKYSGISVFQALSRQIANCNFHINVQNINRLWDKIREQSDIYVACQSCKVFKKLVVLQVITYDKYQSCVDRVQPFKRFHASLFSKQDTREQISNLNALEKNRYDNMYGVIQRHTFIFINKSKYDTRLFKSILGGIKK